jgi:predicted XRE-type DNA-binding protein
MSTNKWSNLRDKRFSEEKVEEIREDALREAIGLKLKQLRENAGITQAELADLIGSDQPEVSRLEERENLLLSTLQDYIHALGGQIEVNAVIDDERVSLVKE